MTEAAAISVGPLLRRPAERNPAKTAIMWEDGQRTYGELLRRVDSLSQAFVGQGIARGERVALLFHNGPEFIETWWAAAQIGAVAVPLSTRALPAELKATINDAEASAVLAGPAFVDVVADLRPELPSVKAFIGQADRLPSGMLAYDSLVQGPVASAPTQQPALTDPCAIYYTAGTTGASKGAVRTHQSVAWGLACLASRIRHDEVYLGRAPMYHTGGSLTGPFAALAAGATLVTMRGFDARSLLETVQQHRVSRLYLHPTLVANALFEELDRQAYDLSSVRYLQWTAGPLPESVRARILARFPGLPLETTYGMTEVSNIASYEYPGNGPIKPANCVGFGVPGTQVAIMDESGRRLGCGEVGEVVVRSPTAMAGYWRDTQATARVFTGGWLHSGDLGHLDEDGMLHLTGRQKDAILTGGENVHASEVESVLAGIPGLAEAAVIGLPDETWGEAVTAVVVIAPGVSLSEVQIRAVCRAELPGYKCPKRIIFATALSKSGVGKVLKRELIEIYSGEPHG